MIQFNKSSIDMIAIPKDVAERLLAAPPFCVKIYLYGLLRGNVEIDQILQELSLTKTEFFEALDFFAENDMVSVDVKDGTSLIYKTNKRQENTAGEVYKDASFNTVLQTLFSDRELTYNDYRVLYECVDVYGLPKQVTLMLAEYCINNHQAKNRVPASYIREVARQWAKEGIDSMDLATKKMQSLAENQEGVRSILRMLGIHRLPTQQEQLLYEKWTNDWAFSFGAIQAATTATTGVQYPTMKYLDGILKNLREEQKLSANAVSEHFQVTERMDGNIKSLLNRLPFARKTVLPDYRKKYIRWRNMGFSQQEMEFACDWLVKEGNATIQSLDALLAGWGAKGIIALHDIKAYLKQREQKLLKIQEMLDKAGVKKKITSADEALYDKFLNKYQMSHDIILYAAASAYGFSAPLRAMDKMLARWGEAGVKTLSQAEVADNSFRYQIYKKGTEFIENKYTKEQLDAKIDDPLGKLEAE